MPSSVPGRAAASSPAPNLFSLRAAASALPPAPWSTESEAGKSAPSALCSAPRALPCPLRGFFQCGAARLDSPRAGDESRGNGQLVRRQSERFSRCRFVNSRHFKQHASGLDHGNPALWSPFAFAHARFGRLFGERLVRENADPQFAAAFDEASDGDARGFDLAVGDPSVFQRFQAVVAKGQISAAPSLAFATPAHLLPVLHFFGHQHRSVLASLVPASFTPQPPSRAAPAPSSAAECSRPGRSST